MARKAIKYGELKKFADFLGAEHETVKQWRKGDKLEAFINPDGSLDMERARDEIPGLIYQKQQRAAWARWHKQDAAEDESGELAAYIESAGADLAGLNLLDLQKANEAEKLLLARIKRGELEGRLMVGEDMAAEFGGVLSTARDILQSLPDRMAAMVTGEPDPAKVRRMLQAEVRRALQAIVDHLKRPPWDQY